MHTKEYVHLLRRGHKLISIYVTGVNVMSGNAVTNIPRWRTLILVRNSTVSSVMITDYSPVFYIFIYVLLDFKQKYREFIHGSFAK